MRTSSRAQTADSKLGRQRRRRDRRNVGDHRERHEQRDYFGKRVALRVGGGQRQLPIPCERTGIGGRSDGGTGIGGTGTGGRATVRSEAGATVTLPSGASGLTQVAARGHGARPRSKVGRRTGCWQPRRSRRRRWERSSPDLLVSSYGEGGDSANTALNISGGDGVGGERNLFATNGGTLTIAAPGGGPGGIGGDGSGSGIGGDGIGGDARLDVDNGLVQLTSNLTVFSPRQAVASAPPAAMPAAEAPSSASSTAARSCRPHVRPPASVSSGAIGGNGTVQGGAGTASSATLTVGGGSSINVANLSAFSTGTGGNASNGIGGNGAGGFAEIGRTGR